MRIPPAIAASASQYAEEVSIRNSENNSDVFFKLRTDRLESFFQFLMANRTPPSSASAMPGISGPAHYALDCIFFGPKPPRFPARDILAFLRDCSDDETVTSQEIEDALGRWAGTVTQLLADGSERA
jgi:hypothetical protein